MVGPVLHHEMLLAGRRSRQYVFRWIYAAWLVIQLAVTAWLWLLVPPTPGATLLGDLSTWFVEMFVVQQLILMTLATPAFAAGAITEEKTSGTLQYLLTSDLTPWQIILGKLLARAFQIGILALTGLPLFCFFGVYAGVEPLTLLAVIGVTVPPLVALVAASLLASVWSTQTRNAALGLYIVVVLGLLFVWGQEGVLRYLDPLYVLEPAWGARDLADARALVGRLLGGLLAWGAVAAICLALATWRLRPAYRRQLENAGKRRRAHWWSAGRPPVGDEPISWKEQHVEGLAPAAFLRRLPRWLGVLTVFVASTASSCLILWLYRTPGTTLQTLLHHAARLDLIGLSLQIGPAEEGFQAQGVVVMLLASLLVGIRCSGAVSGEREKQTWEALLLTPLTAKQLIRGKLWGIMGASYVFVLAYAVPALSLAMLGGLAALFWAAIWLAVTVLAMYCIGAVGIWCSVRCRTSWRSMLWTVATGYVGGFIIFCASAGPLAILALFVLLALMMISDLLKVNLLPSSAAGFAQFFVIFKVMVCLGLAAIAWVMARLLLTSAQKQVAFRERTLQWQEEPVPRRVRRRFARPVH
ncbi:MAG TPA: ABC transporter permease subunit [Gemmataceae bacterium]|nr:ABC transporter permease subunit [Gemmataceae bacterium]